MRCCLHTSVHYPRVILICHLYPVHFRQLLAISSSSWRRHNPGEKRREDEQTQGGKQQNKDKKKTRQEKHEDRKYIESLTDSTVRIGEEGETKKPKKREFQFFSRVTATTCWVQPIQYNWAGPSLKKREQWRPGRPQVQLAQVFFGPRAKYTMSYLFCFTRQAFKDIRKFQKTL